MKPGVIKENQWKTKNAQNFICAYNSVFMKIGYDANLFNINNPRFIDIVNIFLTTNCIFYTYLLQARQKLAAIT